ncbi:MAG TPA: glycosyltransferase, partial [Pseudomonadota bacterium]|nr:glycosyltransferase [Pseudomonadota bacterium]
MRNLLQLTRSALRVCREHGAAELLRRARGQLHRYRQGLAYKRWLRECEGPAIAAARQAPVGGTGPARPLKISVLLPVYNVDPRWLREAIDSVLTQSYPHLELCIADDASPRPELAPLLRDYERRDPRVKLTLRANNGHIAAASNSALELATGEFVALLDHDDLLAPYALELVALELARCPQADLLFSDEDKIDPRGRRFEPSFKSELNYDLLLSQNQINHLGVYRTALVRAVGGFRRGLEGSQDYDLALRVLEQTAAERVRHIPHILYHWRSIPGSTALSGDAKPYAQTAARRAVHEHLQRRGVAARVLPAYGDWHRVQYALPAEPPLVSVIVRAAERREQLAPLLADLRENTDYRPLEVVLVEPGPTAELSPRL